MTGGSTNRRELYYYGICLACSGEAIRSVSWRGNAIPCDKCEVGFRFLLGRRVLWDDAEGSRVDEFRSVVVALPPANHARKDSERDQEDGTLTPQELDWLFGYGKSPGL